MFQQPLCLTLLKNYFIGVTQFLVNLKVEILANK